MLGIIVPVSPRTNGCPEKSGAAHAYAEADYRFEDGTIVRASLFAKALLQYLEKKRRPVPERVVMLGTPTSAWRMFGLWQESQPPETEETLRELTPPLSKWLGRPVFAMLTSAPGAAGAGAYALTGPEQIGMVFRIAQNVKAKDVVHLDVTHGLRHLPMLGLTCGRLAQALRGARTEAIWYGALDLTRSHGGQAPVVRLDGLEAAMQWSEALAAYDWSGDYRAFAKLLREERVDEAVLQGLSNAAFAELTLRADDAATALRPLRETIEKLPNGSVGSLFRDLLLDRLRWIDQATEAKRLAALAWQHLGRFDYLRAALCGLESARKAGCNNDDGRFRRLAAVRNALAHAHATSDRQGDPRAIRAARQALEDEATLHKTLERLLTVLAPNPLV
jgi:CRISPR-associated Csx2 family protein